MEKENLILISNHKNWVEQVIDSLLEYGLIRVVATLRPLITFKG